MYQCTDSSSVQVIGTGIINFMPNKLQPWRKKQQITKVFDSVTSPQWPVTVPCHYLDDFCHETRLGSVQFCILARSVPGTAMTPTLQNFYPLTHHQSRSEVDGNSLLQLENLHHSCHPAPEYKLCFIAQLHLVPICPSLVVFCCCEDTVGFRSAEKAATNSLSPARAFLLEALLGSQECKCS